MKQQIRFAAGALALAVVVLSLGAGRLARADDEGAGAGMHDPDAAPRPEQGFRLLEDGAALTPDSALMRILEGMGGERLDLAEAVRLALESATEAREAEAAMASARAAVRRERGAFDPELYAEVERSGEESPSASPFSGAQVLDQEYTTGSVGARIVLPFGTEVEASFDATRSRTNSSLTTLNPQYDAAGRIEVTQPLLRGFGPAARQYLTAAERDEEAARARLKEARVSVQAEVESSYWDLYAAERDLAVQMLIRNNAAALLEEARLRAQAGLVGPNQVANARVFLAEQEQAVLDREDRLEEVSDQLASLMGKRPAGSSARFQTTAEPPREMPVPAADDLVALAWESNLELQAQAREVEALESRHRGAWWNALPTLDLFGSLGGNGLSGAGRDVVFGQDTLRTGIDGGFSDAWSQVSGRDYPTWSAGVRLELPIFLREGRGERDRLRAEVRRAKERMEASRRSLEEEVRSRHRDLERGALRLSWAREGVDAAMDQVRIGLLEYRSGQITAFELVRLGGDLALAQRRYSQALVRTARAAAELRRLTSDAWLEREGRSSDVEEW